MYNESINTNNKIISTEVLLDIFSKMNEIKKSYTLKANKEEQIYNSLSFADQINMKREYNHFVSDFFFVMDFYDSTNITIDNYENFITVFNRRLHEIKSIICNFSINYFDLSNRSCFNSINLMIYENSFDIKFAIDSSNNEMTELYNFIKISINEAPEKYDFVMKNKNKICFSYISSLGNIVGIILSTILICFPPVFSIVTSGYWILFPICCLIFGYFFGILIFSHAINNLYKNIDMEQVYDGYDPNTFESKYKYDKQSGLSTFNLSNKLLTIQIYYQWQ